MKTLKEILQKNFPNIDFDKEQHLTSDEIFDSLDIVRLISILRTELNVKISVNEMDSNNFESLNAMQTMIDNLKKE